MSSRIRVSEHAQELRAWCSRGVSTPSVFVNVSGMVSRAQTLVLGRGGKNGLREIKVEIISK